MVQFVYAQHDWRGSRYMHRNLLKPKLPRRAEVVLRRGNGVQAGRADEQMKKRGLISGRTGVCLYTVRHT